MRDCNVSGSPVSVVQSISQNPEAQGSLERLVAWSEGTSREDEGGRRGTLHGAPVHPRNCPDSSKHSRRYGKSNSQPTTLSR